MERNKERSSPNTWQYSDNERRSCSPEDPLPCDTSVLLLVPIPLISELRSALNCHQI